VIDNGRITHIGPAATTAIPADADVVDYVAYGVIGVRDIVFVRASGS
jgi:hypothetical protein